jgi:hypothetical protein
MYVYRDSDGGLTPPLDLKTFAATLIFAEGAGRPFSFCRGY